MCYQGYYYNYGPYLFLLIHFRNSRYKSIVTTSARKGFKSSYKINFIMHKIG